MKHLALVLALVLASPGCCTISRAGAHQIAVEAASHRADLREWSTLTPEQQRKAYESSARAFATLDLDVNGTALPPEFGGAILERKDAPRCPEEPIAFFVEPVCLEGACAINWFLHAPHRHLGRKVVFVAGDR